MRPDSVILIKHNSQIGDIKIKRKGELSKLRIIILLTHSDLMKMRKVLNLSSNLRRIKHLKMDRHRLKLSRPLLTAREPALITIATFLVTLLGTNRLRRLRTIIISKNNSMATASFK